MAKNVLKRGHGVIVYDINERAAADVVGAGARAGRSCKEVAAISEVVITMLPGPAEVEAAVLGTDGILEGSHPSSIHVDMSTGDPLTAQRLSKALSERGIGAIDCPVGRTQAHAIAGTLLLLAGGDSAAIDRVRPVLMSMGDELIHCGGSGMGQAMKLVNNLLSTVLMQCNTEALTLGAKVGLSLEMMLRVLGTTMARSAQLTDGLPAKALKGDFAPGFALLLARKDLGLAVAMAQRLGVPVPVAAVTLQQYSALVAMGHGSRDLGAVLDAQADLLGVRLRLDG